MRPLRPVPVTRERSTPRRNAMRRAIGLTRASSEPLSTVWSAPGNAWDGASAAAIETAGANVGAGVPAPGESKETTAATKDSTKRAISASLASSSAMTPMRAPTAHVSPSPAVTRRSTPLAGASTALTIFSVSTSRISAPRSIRAPSRTRQPVMVPSVISMPHFGIVTAVMGAAITGPSSLRGWPPRCAAGPAHTPARAPARRESVYAARSPG